VNIRSRALSCACMLILTISLNLAPARADVAPASADFSTAMQLFYQQDWPKAIDAFQKVVEKDPRDTMAWFFLFDAYIKRNDLRSMLYQLEQKAVASDNKNPQALAQLGLGYLARYMKEPQTSILDEAQKTLEKAIELDKSNALAHTGLGLVYYTRRMIPRAKGNFLEAARSNPNDIMALERIGEITMVDEKRPQEANEMFAQLAARAPSYPDAWWYVGSSFYDMGEYERCVENLKKVIELDPNGVTQGYRAPMLMGKAYLKLKNYSAAKDAFLLELKLNPNSEEARYLLEQSQPRTSPQPPSDKKGNGKKTGS